MNLRLSPKDRSLVIRWALLSTYGMMIGLPIAFSISIVWTLLRGDILHLTISPSAIDLSYVLIFASTTGFFLGILQARILKVQNIGTSWWITVSTIGLSFGATSIVLLQSQDRLFETAPNYLLSGAMLGLMLGIAQWLILRLQFAHSNWWIATSLIGGIVSSVIVRPLLALGTTLDYPPLFVVFIVFFAFSVGIIYTTITGINMACLLRRRVHASPEAG